MPESQHIPGAFWAFPGSPDREALLEQSRLMEIWAFTGRAMLLNGMRTPIDVFVPRDISKERVEDCVEAIRDEAGIAWCFLLPVLDVNHE